MIKFDFMNCKSCKFQEVSKYVEPCYSCHDRKKNYERKPDSNVVNPLLCAGWRDCSEEPKYYEKLLLYIESKYELDGKIYVEKYMTEGYYHSDNVFCEFSK